MNNMGSWALVELGIDLLTTNQSESFNSTMKHFTEDKSMPYDVLVLKLFQLSEYYYKRMTRALYGVGGEYTVLPHLRGTYNINDPLAVLPVVGTYKKTLEKIKSSHVPPTTAPAQEVSIIELDAEMFKFLIAKLFLVQPENERFLYGSSSILELAQKIIDENRITHVSAQKCFMVKGSSSMVYTVVLFTGGRSVFKCSCPATAYCSHVVAAILSIGMDPQTVLRRKKSRNTGLMMKKAKKGNEKKGGKKKPRLHDIIPSNRNQSLRVPLLIAFLRFWLI